VFNNYISMKKLIFTKFLKELTKAFFLTGASLSIIIWVIQSVNYLDLVIEDGHGLDIYFKYSLMNFPKIFSKILPLIFFFTLFYKILEYEKKNELLIFWTFGVSKSQFVNILISFSLIIFFVQVLLGGFVKPLSQNKARSFIIDSNIDFFPSLVRQGQFIDVISGLTIFIEKKTAKNQFHNILITEELNNGQKKIIYAKKGSLVSNSKEKKFYMTNGNIVDQNNNKSTFIQFDELNFNLAKYGSKTITFPKIQETNNFKLSKCLFYFYENKIEQFKEEKFNCQLSTIDEVRQELLRRFYLPFYLPLISLLCAALIIKSKEDKNYHKLKYFLFFFIFFIIVFSELSLKYYFSNIYSVSFFSLFPLIIFTFFYLIVTQEKKI